MTTYYLVMFLPPNDHANSFEHSFEVARFLRFVVLHFFTSITRQPKSKDDFTKRCKELKVGLGEKKKRKFRLK